jgi:hypothetical protein
MPDLTGAKIRVESLVRKGSTFTFCFSVNWYGSPWPVALAQIRPGI